MLSSTRFFLPERPICLFFLLPKKPFTGRLSSENSFDSDRLTRGFPLFPPCYRVILSQFSEDLYYPPPMENSDPVSILLWHWFLFFAQLFPPLLFPSLPNIYTAPPRVAFESRGLPPPSCIHWFFFFSLTRWKPRPSFFCAGPFSQVGDSLFMRMVRRALSQGSFFPVMESTLKTLPPLHVRPFVCPQIFPHAGAK